VFGLDAQGQAIGGVALFHYFPDTYANLERARRAQTFSLDKEWPKVDRVGRESGFPPSRTRR